MINQTGRSSWSFGVTNVPNEESCSDLCIKDTNCDFYQYGSGGQCSLHPNPTDFSHITYYKTNDGGRIVRNSRIKGWDIRGGYNTTLQGCIRDCNNNPSCDFLESDTLNRENGNHGCYLKRFKIENTNGGVAGVKNNKVEGSFTLTDEHPYIIDNIRRKPDRSDLKYNNTITFPEVNCQVSVCTQLIDRAIVEDSINPNFEQALTCVNEINSGSPSPTPTPTPTSPPPSSPSPTPSTPPSTPPTPTPSEEDDSNLNLWLGLGGGGVALSIISILVVVIIVVVLVL